MIHFAFAGHDHTSLEKRENAKKDFFKRLGILKDEFEQKNGHVTVTLFESPETSPSFLFGLSAEHDTPDFIERLNIQNQG